jgi:predicted AAA+ superfamily ATPase
MYKKRLLEDTLLLLAQQAKVILLLEARQVGKSTLVTHLFPDYPHTTFDAFYDPFNVKTDPDLFLKQYDKPLILDEIQYQPELISAIKHLWATTPFLMQKRV